VVQASAEEHLEINASILKGRISKMPEYPVSKLRKIKYNSPSGYVNIGKYIPPFEPIKDGFGYMGVIMEDYKTGKIQCHICGEWLEIFNSHLKSKHNITSNEYREKFGLLRSTALRSKKMRLKQSQVMIDLRKQKKFQNYFPRKNSFAGNRKNKPKSLEHKNKFGVCDLQIIEKVMELGKELNKTPTLVDLKNRYGWAFITTLHSRYGSYITYCRKNGLVPAVSSHNPKYSREYFMLKAKDKEPCIRILTVNEARAFYRHFKSVKAWKEAVIKAK
jgi:hypothetical protein